MKLEPPFKFARAVAARARVVAARARVVAARAPAVGARAFAVGARAFAVGARALVVAARSRAVAGRRPAVAARAFAVLIVAVAAVAGCAAGVRAIKPDAQLLVDAAVPDARIYVDDVFAGRAAELRGRAILVPAGTRRVEIRADGYFTAYRDVTVAHGARAAVTVALHAAPPNEPAE